MRDDGSICDIPNGRTHLPVDPRGQIDTRAAATSEFWKTSLSSPFKRKPQPFTLGSSFTYISAATNRSYLGLTFLLLSMASSLFCQISAPTAPFIDDSAASRQLGSSSVFPKSSFLHGTNLSTFSPPSIAHAKRRVARRCFKSPFAKSLDHIPKQFRQENLKDGCE